MNTLKTLSFLSIFSLCSCGGGTQTTRAVAPPLSNVVAFMGDSIFQYWDIAKYDKNPTIDLGIAGNTTQQMQARFQAQVIDEAPGVVVILGGDNDLKINGEVNTDSIAAMAQMATQAGIRVILCSDLPANYPALNLTPAAIEAFNAQLLQLAKENGYLYVDYYDVMLTADGQQDASLFMDPVHPNAAGYARMWTVLEPLLNEALQ